MCFNAARAFCRLGALSLAMRVHNCFFSVVPHGCATCHGFCLPPVNVCVLPASPSDELSLLVIAVGGRVLQHDLVCRRLMQIRTLICIHPPGFSKLQRSLGSPFKYIQSRYLRGTRLPTALLNTVRFHVNGAPNSPCARPTLTLSVGVLIVSHRRGGESFLSLRLRCSGIRC